MSTTIGGKNQPQPVASDFATWLADRLHEDRISKAEFARQAGVTPTMVGKYLAGSLPGADKVKDIAAALSLDEEAVLTAITGPTHARGAGAVHNMNLGGAARPPGSITDLLDDPERARAPTEGLVPAGGGLVAEGYDSDGLMYAVELVFHIRPTPRRTVHDVRDAGGTEGLAEEIRSLRSEIERLGRESSVATSADA